VSIVRATNSRELTPKGFVTGGGYAMAK